MTCCVHSKGMRSRYVELLLLLLFASWPARSAGQESLSARFAPPPGASRTDVIKGSFAHFLRHYPLLPPGTPVTLHTGALKGRQDVHAAVLDLSVGRRDLQQCADATMRLRAEYHYARGEHAAITFSFTNGFVAEWDRWRRGERVRVTGDRCTWYSGGPQDSSHAQLLKFMDLVFTYAGTRSLARDLVPCTTAPMPGDIFIKGGSPGHAVIVMDVARRADGRTYLLLAQSYMPAQQMHVLRNHITPDLGPWFEWNVGAALVTPEWTFAWGDRRCWPGSR